MRPAWHDMQMRDAVLRHGTVNGIPPSRPPRTRCSSIEEQTLALSDPCTVRTCTRKPIAYFHSFVSLQFQELVWLPPIYRTKSTDRLESLHTVLTAESKPPLRWFWARRQPAPPCANGPSITRIPMRAVHIPPLHWCSRQPSFLPRDTNTTLDTDTETERPKAKGNRSRSVHWLLGYLPVWSCTLSDQRRILGICKKCIGQNSSLPARGRRVDVCSKEKRKEKWVWSRWNQKPPDREVIK